MSSTPRHRDQTTRPLPAEADIEPVDDRTERVSGLIGDLFTRGATAGLASGLVFLIATMGYVTTKGLPSIAPLLDISTIFRGTDEPELPPRFEDAFAGLVTHLTLSIAFGITFALLVGLVTPAIRRWPLTGNLGLIVAGVAFGLVLYIVNFQILGRTLFPWFTNPMGPNQGFEIFIHAVFGALLAPFFFGIAHWLRRPARGV